MKLIKNLLERKNLLLFIAFSYTLILLVLCLISSKKIPSFSTYVGLDKVYHFVAHFVLTFVWVLYFSAGFRNKKNNKPERKAFLISLFLGVLVEFAQSSFTATRSGDFLDVVANISGSLTFILVFSLYRIFVEKK